MESGCKQGLAGAQQIIFALSSLSRSVRPCFLTASADVESFWQVNFVKLVKKKKNCEFKYFKCYLERFVNFSLSTSMFLSGSWLPGKSTCCFHAGGVRGWHHAQKTTAAEASVHLSLSFSHKLNLPVEYAWKQHTNSRCAGKEKDHHLNLDLEWGGWTSSPERVKWFSHAQQLVGG